jgi:hypothetical protein
MAITSTAKADAAKNFRMEVFDTSSTWTVPEGVTAVEVVAVGAGGGGGGGAGGAGNPLATSTPASWAISDFGAGGGAGGGGAGHIQRALVSVTPGDTIPITIGAAGTGGKKLLESRVVNYIENPVFQSNITGWSMSGGATFVRGLATDSTTFSLSGGQNTYPIAFAQVFIATNNTFNFSYDSGTGKTFDQDVFLSTFTGYQLKFGYNSNTNVGLSTVLGVLSFLNGSNTLATFQATPVSNMLAFSQANTRTFTFLNFPTAIPPVSADRFIVSLIAGTQNSTNTLNLAVTMRFTEFMLVPRIFEGFGNRNTGFGGGYTDPSLRGIGTGNTFQMFFWSGTPKESRSLTTYVWGAPVQALNTFENSEASRIFALGFNGRTGTNGGNTLFGTQVIALGGGAGGGGRVLINALPGITPTVFFVGSTGGNGGGGGGFASFQTNPSGQPRFGGGGGATNGWLRVNSPAAFPSGTFNFSPSQGSVSNQGLGLQGWGGGVSGQNFGMGGLGNYGGNSSPVVGGLGEADYGWGGNGGLIGAPSVNAYNTNSIANFQTNDQFSRFGDDVDFNQLTFQPNAKAGGGKFMTLAVPSLTGSPHPSGGIGYDGEDGQNAIGYGSGGAGANGGGAGSSVAFNTNQAGRGGFGGDGGDGGDGYMILMYWE